MLNKEIVKKNINNMIYIYLWIYKLMTRVYFFNHIYDVSDDQLVNYS